MSLTQTAWKWHRWLAYGVGLQFALWLSSGLVFAWLPFNPWVKGGDDHQRPPLTLSAPATLPAPLAGGSADIAGATLVNTPRGAAWRLSLRGQPPQWWPADGSAWIEPDAAAVTAFAQRHYRGTGAVRSVERLEAVPRRLGIVDETGGRGPLWRVSYDDALGTRLYFDGRSGEFFTHRNEAWVWYDFFWRLHIMDYGDGEDFNNVLLRVAASSGWLMGLAGVVLTVMALRRAWNRFRQRRASRSARSPAP
jgi:hypothetical protein